MNNTRILQVKIADEQERLNNILEEIRLHENKLIDILEQEKNIEDSLLQKKKDLAEYSQIHINLSNDIDIKSKELSLRESILDYNTKSLIVKEEDSKLTLKSIQDEISRIESKCKYDLQIYNERITFSKDYESKLNSSVLNLTAQESILIDSISNKTLTLNLIEKEIYEKEEERQKVLRDLSSFVINSNKEKDKILKEIEEEKSKIVKPMELLAEANQYIDRKQNNLNILISRFRKEFAKLHPELGFPI